MVTLGISALDNDTTTAVLVDGALASVVMEERLTRKKHQNGFPHRGLELALRLAGVRLEDVTAVAYPFYAWPREALLMARGLVASLPYDLSSRASLLSKALHEALYARWVLRGSRMQRRFHRELLAGLQDRGLAGKLVRVEHHLAHAAGGFAYAGFERALIFTLDWYGSGCAGTVSLGDAAGVRVVQRFGYPNSLGLFYAQLTEALGYVPCHHEGKIVGLAAYGDAAGLADEVYGRFRWKDGSVRFLNAMDPDWLRQLTARHRKEDIAAACQRVLERIASDIVKYYVGLYRVGDVVLAGGVAANVRMNQRVLETEGVRRLFVYPDMGDGGTGLGAAIEVDRRLRGAGAGRPRRFRNLFLGPDYGEREIESVLRQNGLAFARAPDLAGEVAGLLARGHVVGRFAGRMEFGPRALGHRSVLSQAIDPAINDTLNQRLGRTEFMPFAPATLDAHAEARYRNLAACRDTARFMTITCDCTPVMRRESPAAVHIDGTARPQIVDRETAPDFHAILAAYHQRTGIPTLINTSFNMHEEPIVCRPEDAVAAFLAGRIDVLAIGPFLVHHPHVRPLPQESWMGQKASARRAHDAATVSG
jgi:carbamoyltransferase